MTRLQPIIARVRRLADTPLQASLLLFGLALALRLLVNGLVLGFGFISGYDSDDYLAIAIHLLQGQGMVVDVGVPTALRPPFYPLFIAAVYGVAGIDNLVALKIAESLIGALTCVLIYLIGRTLFGALTGLAAGLIGSAYPILIFYTGAVSTENLFAFLLALVVYLLLRAADKPGLPVLVLCGVVLALATLTRPTTLLLPPFILLWAWLVRGSFAQAFRMTLIIGIAMLLTILPWTVRNYYVMGEPVLITTVGGRTFWGANNPVAVADPEKIGRWISYTRLPHDDELEQLGELEVESRSYELGTQYLRENPQVVPRLLLAKLTRFWTPLPNRDTTEQLISIFSYGMLLPFAVVGLVIDMRRRQQMRSLLLVLVMLIFVINTLVFYGSTRLRLPIEPYIVILATYGLGCTLQLLISLAQPAPKPLRDVEAAQ